MGVKVDFVKYRCDIHQFKNNILKTIRPKYSRVNTTCINHSMEGTNLQKLE